MKLLIPILLLASVIVKADDRLYVASIAADVAANAADVGSSMRPGLYEANPILGGMDARGIAIKGAVTVGVLTITHQLYRHGHKRLATWLNFGMAAGYGAVAVHNERVGR